MAGTSTGSESSENRTVDFDSDANSETFGFLCQQFTTDRRISIDLVLRGTAETVASESDVRDVIARYSVDEVRQAIAASMDEIEERDRHRRTQVHANW